jgi:hypothetical protein
MNSTMINESSLAGNAPKHIGSLASVKSIFLTASLALGLMAQPAQAALTFSFNYGPVAAGGFTDPTYGADRQAALDDAASMLGSYFTNYNANLTYNVVSYSTDNNTLASAGSDVYTTTGESFGKTVVQAKIISNGAVDYNGADADGDINWNFFHNWGLTDTVAADEIDFKSTAMHELLHSFGFLSLINEDGSGGQGHLPGTPDVWSSFDYFLTDAEGNYLIDGDGVFDPNGVSALTAGEPNNAGVLFDGPSSAGANGGNGVPIYTPDPWEEGSSLSHLDDNSDITDTSIMNAVAHGNGLDVRTLGELELGILKDIGYTEVSAVPVPAAIWFLGSGFMAMFGFARRSRAA